VLRDELQTRLKGKVLVVGIGNSLRGDDAFGPEVIERLTGKVTAHLVDVGEVPESYLGRLIEPNPETILLLDAANIGEVPGTAAVLEIEDLGGRDVSTHQMPLQLFFSFVRNSTHADIFMLAVQPKLLSLGSPMSPEVESTTGILSEILIDLLSKAPEPLPA
jgi:hydrogenase 3 maturation protease